MCSCPHSYIVLAMDTEVWFRSPQNYVRELLECNERNVIFDYGYLHKRKIDPLKWCDLHFGTNRSSYRLIVCGEQGSPEYTPGNLIPIAVYSTWQYGDDEGVLEEYLQNNVGEDEDLTSLEPTATMPLEVIPVKGQEHRVIVMNYPELNTGPGKLFAKFLKELQEEYPDAILHLHGATTFSLPVRLGYRAFDFEPRIPAAGGAFYTPVGKSVRKNDHREPHKEWLRVLGFRPVDMDEPRNRCICNIRAASWAAKNFVKDLKIVTTPASVDTTTPDAEYDPKTDPKSSHFFKRVSPLPGDKYVCDSCSLSMACKFYREGSVCTLPSSEPKALSSYFKTRDAGTIIDGLGEIMEIQADRVKTGVELEKTMGLDPEVTKIINSLFTQGTQLAKLVDPTLRNPKVQVQIGNNGGQTLIQMGDPRQFIAQAIKELEGQGFARDQITSEMIQAVLTGAGARPVAAVEAPRPVMEIPVPVVLEHEPR